MLDYTLQVLAEQSTQFWVLIRSVVQFLMGIVFIWFGIRFIKSRASVLMKILVPLVGVGLITLAA